MEDMEMRHNSSLKQLMREFNTQMALKEKELEGSVKETIGKRSIITKVPFIAHATMVIPCFADTIGIGIIPWHSLKNRSFKYLK